jgi:Cu+-exporting ATPase
MKKIFISISLVLVLIVAALVLSRGGNGASVPDGKNVSTVNGRQIIDLTAKGGYSPERSIARAGIPTTLRFTTNGNYDCSSSVRIPSINVSKNLELSGITEIDLGTPGAGVLHGSCGMGMYPFEINFEE